MEIKKRLHGDEIDTVMDFLYECYGNPTMAGDWHQHLTIGKYKT